jgi:hypothetical protein
MGMKIQTYLWVGHPVHPTENLAPIQLLLERYTHVLCPQLGMAEPVVFAGNIAPVDSWPSPYY